MLDVSTAAGGSSPVIEKSSLSFQHQIHFLLYPMKRELQRCHKIMAVLIQPPVVMLIP